MKRAALAAAASLALAVAGCGGTERVTIPDVTGLGATEAVAEIESVGDLEATFAEQPADPSLCTVEDQDETGEAAPDTRVVLTLSCNVEIPDVTGMPADDARREIEAVAGLTADFDPATADPAHCTVEDQDEGATAPDSTVVLSLSCQVDVPDVTGEPAEDAQGEIEAAGDVTASFEVEPSDASLCSVVDQSETGLVDEGTDIVLSLECEEEDPIEAEPEPDEDGGAGCHPSYPDECLDPAAEDYDCEGGSGDGPEYVAGPITVEGDDPFDLDRNGDGVGCE